MKKKLAFLVIAFLLISLIPISYYGESSSIPTSRQLPRLVDQAGLLSEADADSLLDKLNEISERQNLDVVVITVDSLQGLTATEFADDVFDYNGFGMGPDYDGILFLISMEARDWAISTHGYGITAFTDYGQEQIMDRVLPSLSSGNYSKAFNSFADLADDYISQAKTGEPYDIQAPPPRKRFKPINIPISLIGGAVVAFIITGGYKSQLKSVRKQYAAAKYITNSRLNPALSNDLYLYSTVTKTAKPKESKSSGGGGSSTHTSSSGRTHGGSSGKF